MRVSMGMGGGLPYLEITPPDAPDTLPLVVALHGRGASAEDLAPLAGEVPGAYRWIFPNAPHQLDVGGWEGYAWYNLNAAERDLPGSRGLVEGLLGDLWARYGVTPSRTVLLGFSQGAVVALDVGLRAAVRFAGLVAMSGYLAEVDNILTVLPRARGQRVLIVHGTEDPVLPIERGRALRQALDAAGLAPEYHEFDMGHEVTGESLAVVARFLAAALPASAPSGQPD